MSAISFAEINSLIDGKIGRFDVACPLCGPTKRRPSNRRRKVLRIWHLKPGFASYNCARCEAFGYATDHTAERCNPEFLQRARAQAQELRRIEVAQSRQTVSWLWSKSERLIGSIAETYLRECRKCKGPIPSTLAFLPAYREHPPAMIAAFGFAHEPEPGRIEIADHAVVGCHITKLKSDGSDKADCDEPKITIGMGHNAPIMLAPPNDLLGLVISEGIEDALSAYEAAGLGAWAAGTAGRLPAIAEVVPDFIEAVTILAHDDESGRRGAIELGDALVDRRIEVLIEGFDDETAPRHQ